MFVSRSGGIGADCRIEVLLAAVGCWSSVPHCFETAFKSFLFWHGSLFHCCTQVPPSGEKHVRTKYLQNAELLLRNHSAFKFHLTIQATYFVPCKTALDEHQLLQGLLIYYLSISKRSLRTLNSFPANA